MKLIIGGSQVSVDVKKALGKGMEADVYRLGNLALKVFKGPKHPDLLTDMDREAARRKIEEHQTKLRQFPSGLPSHVVVPIDLAQDSSGRIVGYTMSLVDNPRQARSFGQVSERMNGIDPNQIVSFFGDLHETVSGLHSRHVVIGDFNDLNVLVSDRKAYVIDADSFQFGGFPCRMYTEEFVDPRLCDPNGSAPVLSSSHDPVSDWYAYSVMLFKLLLCVGPFGGVYKPSKQKNLVLHTQRPLKGVSVFNPEVVYPKKAVPFRMLSDEILDYFQKTFEKGHRIEFPKQLLSTVHWTKCSSCGAEYARPHCPDCKVAAPMAAVKERIEVKGKIKSTMIFRTTGHILNGSMQRGKLLWLYSEGGKFYREDRASICNGSPEPGMRFRISGESTVIGKGGSVFVLSSGKNPVPLTVDQFQGGVSMFDTSSAGLFWVQGGSILRGNSMGLDYEPDRIGQVLEGQTLFWVGDSFGVGFYRAGEVNVSFVFDATGRGLNDGVVLPKVGGQLVGAKCFFSSNRAAMMFSYKNGPKITNRCVLIKSNGEILGMAEGTEGDGTWLSSIAGKCVAGDSVMSATDDGIVRVDFAGGAASKETRFDGSEAFVDSSSHLFSAPDGLYCIGSGKVSLIQICR